MWPYQVYLHADLLESVPRTGVQRRKIMNFICHLREHLDTKGDFEDKDAVGRLRQIKIVGDYAITYWLHAPVRMIMIVEVKPADT